ncbi:MAG: hypothetical protein J5819_10135, partial [Eubacterium sp.]|nr:hypothetical protein [Eubacterium sp.]
MRRKHGKRLLAGFLAITLFLTSGFLILFRDSVFGAKNKDYTDQANPYVDFDNAQSLNVVVRGKGSATPAPGSIILTDEGSNQKDKTPKKKMYKGWTFTYEKTVGEGENAKTITKKITIPSTTGAKGTVDNPFVVLEVVPDEAMQELSYFAGTDSEMDNGLAFDEGYLSATLMDELRKANDDEGFRLTNVKFTMENMDKPGVQEAYNQYINNNIATKVGDIYGRFLQTDFKVFSYQTPVPSGTTSATDPTPIPTMQPIDVYNDKSASEKVGTYNFNELYNISITTDDLLQVLPTKMVTSWSCEKSNPWKTKFENYTNFEKYMDDEKAKNPNVFFEYAYTDGSDGRRNDKEYYEREYTDDLIAFVAADPSVNKPVSQITSTDIENYIRDVLCGVSLNYNSLKNNKEGDNSTTNKTTEIVKYNLKDFSQADWLKPGIGQDITYQDYIDSGIFDFYDVSQSIIRRGSNYHTRHLELYKRSNNDGLGTFSYLEGSPKKEITNYWKVQFRKKYIDTFTTYYDDYIKLDKEWKDAEPTDGSKLNDDQLAKYRARNEALEKLMKTFLPFFERMGVNPKTMEDGGNWETTTKTVLSNVRKYEVDHAGGYILAVKPGKGDMYLLNDNQTSKIVNKLTDEEKAEMGVNDPNYLDNLFVFSRDDKDSVADDTLIKDENQKRWLFVPTQFALNGDMVSGDYHEGYLDDSDYTFGFASKSVRNKSDITLAIYDRQNRRHHGREQSGKADVNKQNVGDFSYSSTAYFDWGGGVYPESQRNEKIYVAGETFSNKMLYYTNSSEFGNRYGSASNLINDISRTGNTGAIDEYHLNVWNEIHKSTQNGGLGIAFSGDEGSNQRNIDEYDNLIDRDGRYWGGTMEGGENWLFNNRGSNKITGLCFNFRDVGISTDPDTDNPKYVGTDGKIQINYDGKTHPYNQMNPEIYSKSWINGFDYYCALYQHPL